MAQAALFSATISATGAVANAAGQTAFSVQPSQSFMIFLGGGTLTVQMEASPDGGSTWYTIAPGGNQIYVWTQAGLNISDPSEGFSTGLQYRFNCTAFTSSGTVSIYPVNLYR